MKGIIDENLDTLIKKNNFNADSLSKNLKILTDSIDELDDCYSGNSINFVFMEVAAQKDNIKKISNMVKNYSEVLSNVKIAYHQQDERFHEVLNNTNL